MSKSMSEGKEEVALLCAYFRDNRNALMNANVKEAHVRQLLIDPFYEALGWDVRNVARVAPQYREVLPEASIDIDGHKRAPDYAFRIGQSLKFYVEAKKCGVDLNASSAPAFQLRRYGWSAKVSLSLLTDFEELAVYDCSRRPKPQDKASNSRIIYMRSEEYVDRWEDLWSVFSREAIWDGAFDRYVTSNKKRGTAEVDSEFLKEIEQWREQFARNFALRNMNLSQGAINRAVQLTIDRIIFLRMAEDRGLEPEHQLLALCDRDRIYGHFVKDLCRRADAKYNSGLFHFRKEDGDSLAPDVLTPTLVLDDRVLRPILQSLYFEHGSPYDFGVMPVEILGTVYERFLGKIIRLTPGHRAKVEEKPEVRKAGGVYYTPRHIVDAIVEATVGRSLVGRSPSELVRNNFRVLDMACGSGSFLLGAYRSILDHCLQWYIANDPQSSTGQVWNDARTGDWRLTIAEKKRLLLSHIYGVDLDEQAVEVSKLALLLKVLEGESNQTVATQLTMFQERALPDLANNIKCGNSLVGRDYFGLDPAMAADEIADVKPFEWDQMFAKVMRSGGFDVVIGNPPYVRPHNIEPRTKEYLWAHFTSFERKGDLYCCFMEKAVHLVKTGGRIGFIVSNGWLRLDSFQKLRQMFLESVQLEVIADLPGKVFADAQVKTCIVTALKTAIAKTRDAQMIEIWNGGEEGTGLRFQREKMVPQHAFRKTYKNVYDLSIEPATDAVRSKMREIGRPLGETFSVCFGLKTGDDARFIHTERLHDADRPLLRGADVSRYGVDFKGEYVCYLPEEMRRHRRTARPGEAERFEQPKLLIKDTTTLLAGSYDRGQYYAKDVLIVLPREKSEHDEFVLKCALGILNSKMMSFYYRTTFRTIHVQSGELASLPLPSCLPSSAGGSVLGDALVALVDAMLDVVGRTAVGSERKIGALEKQSTYIDEEIEEIVRKMFGLGESEIATVRQWKI